MVIKKGTVGVVDYVVYRSESVGTEWRDVKEIPNSEPIDERKQFRFLFGTMEIEPEVERRLKCIGDEIVVGHEDLVYYVKWTEGADIHLTLDEIFNEVMTLKNIGNELVKSGHFSEAYDSYAEGIALMTSPDFNRRTERDLAELFIPLYLNQALCCLKTKRVGEAIDCCNHVLQVDRTNIKALYRRSVSRMENRQYGAAKRDILLGLSIDERNMDFRAKLNEIEMLEKTAQNEAEKAMYQRMVTCNPKVRMVMSVDGEECPLTIQLFEHKVPKTVKNFKQQLSKYLKCKIFKLVQDQFFQTGDYDFNDGSGGNAEVWDKEVKGRRFMNDESLEGHHSEKGIVGMANYGPNTNQSQFYITLGPCPQLDGEHVVFGRVIDGFDSLGKINRIASEKVEETRPSVPFFISKIELVE